MTDIHLYVVNHDGSAAAGASYKAVGTDELGIGYGTQTGFCDAKGYASIPVPLAATVYVTVHITAQKGLNIGDTDVGVLTVDPFAVDAHIKLEPNAAGTIWYDITDAVSSYWWVLVFGVILLLIILFGLDWISKPIKSAYSKAKAYTQKPKPAEKPKPTPQPEAGQATSEEP